MPRTDRGAPPRGADSQRTPAVRRQLGLDPAPRGSRERPRCRPGLVDLVAAGPGRRVVLAWVARWSGNIARSCAARRFFARPKPLAVVRERRVRDPALHGAAVPVNRTSRARSRDRSTWAMPDPVHAHSGSWVSVVRGVPESQLVEPVHLDLRDVGLAAARRRHRARVTAHLRAEGAVVELTRDGPWRERLGHIFGHAGDYS